MNSGSANAIETALAHHQAGRYAQAEAVYRQILESNPNTPQALHLLGVACSQQGRKEMAVGYIQRAIALQPNSPDFHSNLALVFLENREIEKSVESAQRALALRPDHAEAMNILGNGLKHLGRLQEAITWLQRSLAAKPDQTDALSGLADVYRRLGRVVEADACSQRILALQPDNHDALAVRGEALLTQLQFADAAAIFQAIIRHHPQSWVGHNGLGVALFRQGRFAESIPLYEKSIELAPENPGSYNNIGYAYVVEGRVQEAVAYFQKALALRPDFPEAHNNLGNAYNAMLELDQSLECYHRTLFFQPDNSDAHWNKALLLLLRGDFANGFREYEWRWLKFPEQRRSFRQPLWDGFDIRGKHILLHTEQGYGDTIQFIRFAPLIVERGATVTLECQRELVPLLQGAPGLSRTIARGDPLPPFDVHCPLLTLAYSLGISIDTIPANVPYLKPIESLRARWEQTLRPYQGTLKVGIAWAGSSTHARDRDRSATLEAFAPLAALPNVTLVSLQKRELGRPMHTPNFKLIDLTAQLDDFGQTAALIANLDLVISVDTVVAHLAGAMGKPVWTLLAYSPDWRWLLSREDSPWYPTMRLFRQPRMKDWASVMRRVTDELSRSQLLTTRS